MGGKIGFILILIVALGVGVYLYSSGAFTAGLAGLGSLARLPGSSSSTASSSGLGSFSFFDFGSSTIVQGPPPPSGSSGSAGGAPTQPTLGNAIVPTSSIPAGFTAAELSPYFGQVRFGSVSAASYYSYGTITLNTAFPYNATGTIDVTGWQIRANHGDEYIPQAVNLYDPTGLAPATDIQMKNGDTLYLYSSSAPFNLRLNECIGYAAHVANFTPPLPLTCPYVDQSQIQGFSGACQNFINSIGACQQPNYSSAQFPQNDYSCTQYLENNFTYRSCFDQHSNDPNFLSDQIWVWTGANPVDPYHDQVELLDKQGLLVDLYTY
ncbi:MAG TPA: hypothetical protein VMA75_01560 [Candidatus Paceibacterota bacterium]|nr:hypothetical protein [Candidatus Paceibacterota bacterium]